MSRRTRALVGPLFLASTGVAFGHVKWFADRTVFTRPLTMGEVLSPTVWLLLGLSVVTIPLLVLVDHRFREHPSYQSFEAWFERRSDRALLVMRITTAMVLLLNWQADAWLVPELDIPSQWIGWLQLFLALLLLFERTTPLVGAGMIALYLMAVARYGFFHMLDYLHYPGVGFFLMARSGSALTRAALPVLYASVGLSLAWLALEKLVYPEWGLQLLERHPVLTLGFPKEFFLTGASFVELSLGFLLLIGLLGRPLAITITVVFFLTTIVFGKTEVIGHTMLHGALIVFCLAGVSGSFRPPADWLRGLSLRLTFSAVSFVLFFAVLLAAYTSVAQRAQFQPPHVVGLLDVSRETPVPTLTVRIEPDDESGFNVFLDVGDFELAPATADAAHVPGQGHAHLYVDGRKAARWYGPVAHIGALPPGTHQLRITLNSNDHRELAIGDTPIDYRTTVEVR